MQNNNDQSLELEFEEIIFILCIMYEWRYINGH